MVEQAPKELVAIRVQPRASRDRVLGERDGVIAIALKAPLWRGRPMRRC